MILLSAVLVCALTCGSGIPLCYAMENWYPESALLRLSGKHRNHGEDICELAAVYGYRDAPQAFDDMRSGAAITRLDISLRAASSSAAIDPKYTTAPPAA